MHILGKYLVWETEVLDDDEPIVVRLRYDGHLKSAVGDVCPAEAKGRGHVAEVALLHLGRSARAGTRALSIARQNIGRCSAKLLNKLKHMALA